MKIKNIADLTKLEEQIYEIVKDHLSETRTINIGDLVPTCFRHFDGAYTKEQIESAMRRLFEKRFFLGVSSLLSADVFENEVRREIFRFVQRNPGAYNRMIRDELGLHSNEFDWHSGMLERFGFLKKIRLNKRQWGYFENRSFMDHEYDLFLIQKDKVRDIIDFLKSHHHVGISQLTDELGMHYSTIKKYLSKLGTRELVYKEKKNGTRGFNYSLNEELYTKLRKIINGQTFVEFAELC